MSIFKACDIRGTYGEDLDGGVAYAIGRAAGAEIGNRSVVVGGDVRPSTPELMREMIRGLVSSGCSVMDIGIVPTPALYFAKERLRAYAGIMVTASHNPAKYNGAKLMFGEMPITPADIQRVERRITEQDFISGSGKVERRDVLADYEDHLRRLLGADQAVRRLRIVVDAGNGCYSEMAPRFLASQGFEVVPLFCTPDGRFPNREPNPAILANLAKAAAAVRQHQAALGVVFDGDGDRVAFIDETGEPVGPDTMIVILAEAILRDPALRAMQTPGISDELGLQASRHTHARHTPSGQAEERPKIVYDINVSMVLREAVERAGGTALMEKSGHAFMKRRMLEEDAIFGGEMSGHFFYRALKGGDDGLYTACLAAKLLLAKAREPLSAMAARVPKYAISPAVRIPCNADEQRRILAALLKQHQGTRPVSQLDGVRAEFAAGWALARMSVTEPVISMRFEGRTEADLKRIIEEFLRPVPELLAPTLERLPKQK
jgi:phosphomannomutase/phosphoglucomutase